jgi:hypothetical protein
MENQHDGINRQTPLKYLSTAAASLAALTWVGSGPATAPERQHFGSEMTTGPDDHKPMERQFFTPHEMKTVRLLCDIIIPADELSGSASDAGVPEFIEFMMKDQPWHQTGMRGGLRWLDTNCMKRFKRDFISCSDTERKTILDEIAYPESPRDEMKQGVNFFNNFRDFVATGFLTSKMGIEEPQHLGKRTNRWQGSLSQSLQRPGMSHDDVDGYQSA